MDWTVGSVAMKAREQEFLTRTGNDVFLGVGSYGNDRRRGGKCYRITATGIAKDIIVQSVNLGGDVADNNFDIQTGDGGHGLFNGCTIEGTTLPQFGGSGFQWGDRYGGWGQLSGCDQLPVYPLCGDATDSLQDLCRWSFANGFRINARIAKMCEVRCPIELYTATGVHRSDEINPTYSCLASGVSGGGMLTRMMDCSSPYFAWAENIDGYTYADFESVVPCRRDGYTRINSAVE